MNSDADRLEHLISRRLDDEATPQERRTLEARVREDAEVRRLFEDTRAVDTVVGDVMRVALGRGSRIVQPSRIRFPRLRPRLAKGLTVAAAAALALAAWLLPPRMSPPRASGRQQAGVWTLHSPRPADVVTPVPVEFERPGVRLRGTQRDWIVIPNRQPGKYVVIEVDRVRTHVVTIQQDF